MCSNNKVFGGNTKLKCELPEKVPSKQNWENMPGNACIRPYEVRIKWINTSLKFSKKIIKVVLINISKLRLLFTVSSTWWSIPDWSIILQHLPSAGQWQTMSLLQDHNVRPYDVHKNKIWSGPHEANPIYRFTQKRFHVIIISSRVLIIWNLFAIIKEMDVCQYGNVC